MSEGTITLQLRDATKSLDRKLPESVGEVKGTLEYDGTHLVDVVADQVDRAGVLRRYVNSNSLAAVKADMGVGGGDPAPSEFIAYRTDNVGAGPDTLIIRPEPAKKFVKSVLELIGAYLVTQEDGRLTMILNDSTRASVDEWDGLIIKRGASFSAKIEATLRNATAVYYDYDGASDYGSIYVVADQDSIDAWGQVNKIIQTKWLAQEPDTGLDYKGRLVAAFIAARETARLKDGVGTFKCSTSLDQLEVQVGDMVTIYSNLVVSQNNPIPGAGAKMMVVSKTWAVDSGTISWELVEAT